MRKIFTGEYIHALDAYTVEHEQISSLDLVDRAARAFSARFCRLYTAPGTPVVIFAGNGKNGADALAIAVELHRYRFPVEVYLFNKKNNLSPECAAKRDIVRSIPELSFLEVVDSFEVPSLSPYTVIIDGLFGSGLNRPLEGGYLELVRFINAFEGQVVSIDLPSGMRTDRLPAEAGDGVVCATYTLTFEFPKLSFFFPESEKYTGKVEVLDIGLSPEGKEFLPADYFVTTDLDIDELLVPRPKYSHKGFFGKALLIAGSRGKMGAAVLAARGALRSGVGKLTTQIPPYGETILQTAVPESMLIIENEQDPMSQIVPLQDFDAIAVGPGLGQTERSFRILENVLSRTKKPLVLDADALNIMAESRDLISRIPEGSILTPHAAELERLTGYCPTGEKRLEEAKVFAARYGVFVILKGANSAICTPSGQVIFNPTGNPALATPGSGDVLTGILLGLLAQGYPSYTTAILGTYLHGLAADYYAARYDQYSMLASDIATYLPEAFKGFSKNRP